MTDSPIAPALEKLRAANRKAWAGETCGDGFTVGVVRADSLYIPALEAHAEALERIVVELVRNDGLCGGAPLLSEADRLLLQQIRMDNDDGCGDD